VDQVVKIRDLGTSFSRKRNLSRDHSGCKIDPKTQFSESFERKSSDTTTNKTRLGVKRGNDHLTSFHDQRPSDN
jgi:hypothetical protein